MGLVTAAAGGVGLAAVQIAKALGAKVIAATGSPQKMQIAKRLGGADYVINYSKPGWQKEVLALTNERGVDVIFDPVGLINDSLKCIARKGRAIVVGFHRLGKGSDESSSAQDYFIHWCTLGSIFVKGAQSHSNCVERFTLAVCFWASDTSNI